MAYRRSFSAIYGRTIGYFRLFSAIFGYFRLFMVVHLAITQVQLKKNFMGLERLQFLSLTKSLHILSQENMQTLSYTHPLRCKYQTSQ